ncbi:MAG: nuclear transport factor 2 family protein [Chitinophagaceae bacterium]|nr:nuclear transport factor 2 family protein [Chitinophagaceae bacterium]
MKSNSNLIEQNVQKQDTNGNKKNSVSETSKNVVERHLKAFADNDLEVLMSDYTTESILITQEATYTSLQGIKAFFAGLNVHFPKQKSTFVLDNFVAKDDLVFIVWHARTPSLNVPLGSDTFIIKGGKISQQTFAGQLIFINE